MCIEVKHPVANNSKHAKEPKKATNGSEGYDLFAAEENIFFPWCLVCRDVTNS